MRGAILKALRESGGNKTKAAEKLGVPKTTLYNKMKKYGIGDTGPHSETKDQA
jgi:DNA-binding NtrC family response regulator